MPAPYPANTVIVKLVFYQRLHVQECQNIFHFRNKQQIDTEDALMTWTNDLGPDFVFRMGPSIQAFQSTQVGWLKTTQTVLLPLFGPQSEHIIEAGAGAQPDDSLPGSVAAIITLRSGFSGRSRRGRLYMTGVPENDHEDGQLDADSYSSLIDIGGALQTNYSRTTGSTQYQHILYSHKLGDDVNGHATLAGVFEIQSYQARRVLGTQRHRLIGHGT